MDGCKWVPRMVIWVKNFGSDAHGHEQTKDRYCLILSNEKFNKSSGMVTLAPFATRRGKDTTPVQVSVEGPNGNNVLLLEQLKTIDISDNYYQARYIYTVDDAVWQKVQGGLRIHFGMTDPIVDLTTLEKVVNNIVLRTIEARQAQFDMQGAVDGIAHRVQEQIEEKFPKPTLKETPKLPSGRRTPGRKTQWTKEKCEVFLNDCSQKPMREVMGTWHISTPAQYYQRRNYVEGKYQEILSSEKSI